MTIPFLHIDLLEFIISLGYIGFFIVVWAESGFFLGVTLPGDSLLFLLGVLASQGIFDLYILLGTLTAAAILGDSFGYWFGKKLGPALFTKEDSRFFKRSYLEKTSAFYEKHGAKTIVIGRFLPIIRTFAPIVAGACGMNYRTFVTYNVFGALFWVLSVTLAGYFLGQVVPGIEKYIVLIVGVIIFLSFIPALLGYLKSRKKP
jgi:membrane-associated protein